MLKERVPTRFKHTARYTVMACVPSPCASIFVILCMTNVSCSVIHVATTLILSRPSSPDCHPPLPSSRGSDGPHPPIGDGATIERKRPIHPFGMAYEATEGSLREAHPTQSDHDACGTVPASRRIGFPGNGAAINGPRPLNRSVIACWRMRSIAPDDGGRDCVAVDPIRRSTWSG